MASGVCVANAYNGLILWGQSDTLVEANTIAGCLGSAITVREGHAVTLTGNTLRDLWWGSGIGLSGADHAVLSNTVTSQWEGTAINVGGEGHRVAQNTVSDIRSNAFAPNGRGHTMLSNTVASADTGLVLNEACQNLMAGNRFSRIWGAATEIFLAPQLRGNSFYHNSFVDNTVQAADHSGAQWDSQGRGNYWSVYTGRDANHHGIGHPLNPIPPSGADPYPLVLPHTSLSERGAAP